MPPALLQRARGRHPSRPPLMTHSLPRAHDAAATRRGAARSEPPPEAPPRSRRSAALPAPLPARAGPAARPAAGSMLEPPPAEPPPAGRDVRDRLSLWDRRPQPTAPLSDRQTDSVLELKAAAENLPVPAEVRRRRCPARRGGRRGRGWERPPCHVARQTGVTARSAGLRDRGCSRALGDSAAFCVLGRARSHVPRLPLSLGRARCSGSLPEEPHGPPWLAGVCRQPWELCSENPRAFSACPRCFSQSTSIWPLEVGSFSRGVHSVGPLKLILIDAWLLSPTLFPGTNCFLERTEESQE